MIKNFLLVFLLTSSFATAATSRFPIFQCELLLGNGGDARLPMDQVEAAVPGLLQLIRNHQPIELYLRADNKKLSRAQATPLKKGLQKLGAQVTLVGLDHTEFHAGVIRLTEASIEALPSLLKGLPIDSMNVSIGRPQAPQPPKMPKTPSKPKRGAQERAVESGRFFTAISIDELKAKIPENILDFSTLSSTLKKDLAKVEFDSENLIMDSAGHPEYRKLLGFHTMGNGLTYLGVMAGGDSDLPIFYIVYWDGSRLRAFIPKDGNFWNPKTKLPYGADPIDDIEAIRKYRTDLADVSDDDLFTKIRFDETKVIKEIESRLKPR